MVNYPTISEVVRWTRQDLFDHVALHMLTQGERSRRGLTRDCYYRDDAGRACAVGACIPADVYTEAFEHKGVTALLLLLTLPQFNTARHQMFACFLREHGTMLMYLLRVHDEVHPLGWPRSLHDLARTFGLDGSVVEHFETQAVRDARDEQASHVMPERLKEADREFA